MAKTIIKNTIQKVISAKTPKPNRQISQKPPEIISTSPRMKMSSLAKPTIRRINSDGITMPKKKVR